jgi:hypothetical protein
MNRQRMGRSPSSQSYHRELLHATRTFLPHRGLPLQSPKNSVRWTDRLLVITAVLLAWQTAPTLKDAFEMCWPVVTGMYPTRRRIGRTYGGFIGALARRSARLLSIVQEALRAGVRVVAGRYWRIDGWVVMGVDGSRVDCPRTAANEAAFGCAGKAKTTPQQLLTIVLHVGTGLVWDWRRGGGNEAERTHLREMIGTLPPEALLLADAGFTGYDLLRDLQANGRAFILRAGRNVHLLRKLGFAVREHEGIVYLWPQSRRGHEPLVLRLVTVREGDKGIYLLTNVLDDSALTGRQVVEMYRRRWGVEVFYRSLKRTMEKYKVRSHSPAHTEVELDWALGGLWMLGLLTVQRMVRCRVNPGQWSVAESLRVVRRVMDGRGGRQAAKDLHALAGAVKDTYRRRNPKAARNWPRKKDERPPGPPRIRMATREERQKAQGVKARRKAS